MEIKKSRKKSKEAIRKKFFLDSSSIILSPYRSVLALAQSSIPPEFLDILKNSDSYLYSVLNLIAPELKDGNPNDIYIPEMVYWELNNLKDKPDVDPSAKFRMRRALSFLSELTIYADRKRLLHKKGEYLTKNGITLPNSALVRTVEHSQKKFDSSTADMYDPTRDDAIIFDCLEVIKQDVATVIASSPLIKKNVFGVQTGQKSLEKRIGMVLEDIHNKDLDLRDKYGKEVLSNLVYQFVTEDTGFPFRVMNEKGKLAYGIDIDVQPLLMERTAHPNPAMIYTGYVEESIVLPNDVYTTVHNETSFVRFNDILSNALNVTLGKPLPKLESLLANQFVLFEPENPDSIHKSPEAFYMRKPTDDATTLVPLTHYKKFMETQIKVLMEFESKDTPAVNEPVIVPPITTIVDAHNLLNKYSEMFGKEKKVRQLHNRLKQASDNPGKLREIYAIIRQQIMGGQTAASKIVQDNNSAWRTRPFNPDIIPVLRQQPYVDSCNNPEMPVTLLLGVGGVGKTLWAIASGIEAVKSGRADCVLYVRPTLTQGQSLGFEPGNFDAKISHIKLSAEDALVCLWALKDSPAGVYSRHPSLLVKDEKTVQEIVNGPINQGAWKYDVINKMAGRTYAKVFAIFDESHNFTVDQFIMWLGRLDPLSKAVITGDPEQMNSTDPSELRKQGLTMSQAGVSHFYEDFKINRSVHTTRFSELITCLSMYETTDVKRSIFGQIADAFRKAEALR